MKVSVAGIQVPYNKHATRWLGVFLDSKLTLQHHHNVRMGKARSAEARIRSLTGRLGLCTENVRRIQIAAVQAVALYGTELWFDGQKERTADIQKLFNRQARSVLGALPTSAIGPLICEAGLTDAETVLRHRRRRLAARLAATPDDNPAGNRLRNAATDLNGNRQPEVNSTNDLLRFIASNAFGGSAPETQPPNIMGRLAATIPRHPTSIEPTRPNLQHPTGHVAIEEDENTAALTASSLEQPTKNHMAVYTDGSRLEDGHCAFGAVARTSMTVDEWCRSSGYIGNNKEAYDAELFGIAAGLELASRSTHVRSRLRQEDPPNLSGTVYIFVDAQAALKRLRRGDPGAGQWMLPRIRQAENELRLLGWNTEYRWVPGHKGIPGNEMADQVAKAAARDRLDRPHTIEVTSLAHIGRLVTDARTKDRNAWLSRQIKAKAYYKRKAKWDKTAAKAPKALASRYFQLRLNKAPTAPYLMWTGRRTDDKCWWCRKAPKQTREHLLKRCARWTKEQEALWKAIGLATKVGGKEGWKRSSTPVARVLADARCTEALLGFLSSTHVGKWPEKPQE
jgi:hypothetical protein